MTDTLTGLAGASEEQVRRDDRAHVFHSWSAQGLIDPLPIASAEGSWFTDYSGRRYLDFSSQLVNVNIGYQHPKLVAAIQEQAARMTTVSPAFANGLWSATILLVLLDTAFLVFRLRREVRRRFPNESHKGVTSYAILRSMQLRWLRLPKRQVKIGERLPERY